MMREDVIVQGVVDGIKSMFVKQQAPIVVQKQLDGRTRVLMLVSNMFKDRHEEIITSAAHKEYEAYVKESGRYPEFWLWHTKGSRWGIADLVSFDDGFLTLSGLVDSGKEHIAESLAELGQHIGVSHGFRGISIQGKGYIDFYRMLEASPLPKHEAANVWTAYMLAKRWEMGLADKHKKFFETLHIPSEVIDSWDKSSKDLAQVLKEAGIEYKEVETETPAPAPVVATETGPTLTDVMTAISGLGSRIDGIEAKQNSYEGGLEEAVTKTLEAAIVSGKGFVASKQGEAPNTEETNKINTMKEQDILTDLILGPAPVGSN